MACSCIDQAKVQQFANRYRSRVFAKVNDNGLTYLSNALQRLSAKLRNIANYRLLRTIAITLSRIGTVIETMDMNNYVVVTEAEESFISVYCFFYRGVLDPDAIIPLLGLVLLALSAVSVTQVHVTTAGKPVIRP